MPETLTHSPIRTHTDNFTYTKKSQTRCLCRRQIPEDEHYTDASISESAGYDDTTPHTTEDTENTESSTATMNRSVREEKGYFNYMVWVNSYCMSGSELTGSCEVQCRARTARFTL